jgi:parallel beta-helix repeat protein
VAKEIMFTRNLLVLACSGVTAVASAADFYVDADNGNDNNDGRSAAQTQDGYGPWQTLARVSRAELYPGDRVFLMCAQRWTEPLSIQSDGTESSPIVIGSWPINCDQKPLIQGGVSISKDQWTQGPDGRWETSWPVNLISNGNFDIGPIFPWTSWSDEKLEHLRLSTLCSAESPRCARLDVLAAKQQAIAISNRFPVTTGKQLTLTLRARLPYGHDARVTVRRHSSPWDELAQAATISGTGDWKTYTFFFTPNANAKNARMDLSLQPRNGPLFFDNVSITEPLGNSIAVHVDGYRLNPAHHPNIGYSSELPKSPYFKLTEDSPEIKSGSASVSNTAYLGSALQLPEKASIKSGDTISIRSRAWILEEHTIAAVGNGVVTLEDQSLVNLQKGWGYFLSGATWMLDSPAEWTHDKIDGIVYLIPQDGAPPGDRVVISWLESGLDFRDRKYVTIQNIAIQNVRDGARISGSRNIKLERISISDTEGYGVDMVGSIAANIYNSDFRGTRLDAIAGSRAGFRIASFSVVENNIIVGSGVSAASDAPTMLPAPARAAIHAGQYATVRYNRIDRVAYVGIRADRESLVEKNHITNSCLVLDDGGAIYVKDTNNNGRISSNIIKDVFGNIDGKPDGSITQTAGVYLDDWTSGIEVSGNTISNADHGVHVHNAFSNTISNNTLFGNRANQIWMQENAMRIDKLGDIHSNLVTGNYIIPIGVENSIYQVSDFSKPTRFAEYSGNVFSTLFSPIISVETWKDSTTGWKTATYNLDQWLNADSRNISPHKPKIESYEVSEKAFAQFEIAGENLLLTTKIEDTTDGWRTWNGHSDKATLVAVSCPMGTCMKISTGGSDTILISPRFSVVKNKWYRMSFDMKTTSAEEKVEFLVRRGGGGGNGYESVMGPKGTASGTGEWTRHALIFKSDKSINTDDLTTNDIGARVDFGWFSPGVSISIGNVEIVPISAVDEVTQLALLSNPLENEQWVDCPDIDSNPDLCERYVSFLDQSPIAWPYVVEAHSSAVIFTRNLELIDSDEDGIADSQDTCPATPDNREVNAAGCSL